MQSVILKLPEKTVAEQKQSKLSWNREHCTGQSDFYTIGYSGRAITDFIDTLKRADVATLVDIRYSPVSRFKPEFSKRNLKTSLATDHLCFALALFRSPL